MEPVSSGPCSSIEQQKGALMILDSSEVLQGALVIIVVAVLIVIVMPYLSGRGRR
jgi:hypothetical protein